MIRRDVDDKLGIGRCLNVLGSVQYNVGNLDEAEDYHERALEKFREVGDSVGEARYQFHLGNIALERRLLSDALDKFRTAEEQFEEIGSSHGIARAKHGLGRTLVELDRLEDAKAVLSESLDIYESFSAYATAIDVSRTSKQCARPPGITSPSESGKHERKD